MGIPALRGAGAYAGPERRVHTVLVTRNTEYHCRSGRCIAVRDRTTGEFSRDHNAVGLRMTGGVRYNGRGGVDQVSAPEELLVGEKLCFESHDGEHDYEVVTSPLVGIERPPREIVARYDATG